MSEQKPMGKGVQARLIMVLIVVLLVTLPVASAHLRDDDDKVDIVIGRTCAPCHGNATPDNVSIVLDAPTQTSYTPDNRSIVVEVGILGIPDGYTAFGLLLNGSVPDSGVRWTNDFGDAGDDIIGPANKVRAKDAVLYSIDTITRDWFNLSFIPGQVDQTIELTVIGMQADKDGTNNTDDHWTILEGHTMEVKKQRLLNLTVLVKNDSDLTVGDVPVDFFIDDEYIGQSKVDYIPAKGEGHANISWDVTFIKDGKYTMKAVIDPDGRITEIDKSNNIVTRSIWLGGPPEPEDRSVLYAVGAVIVVVVVAGIGWYLYRRRLYRF